MPARGCARSRGASVSVAIWVARFEIPALGARVVLGALGGTAYAPCMEQQNEPLRGLSKDEQETTVVRTRTSEWTLIETTIPTDISALRRNPRVEEVGSGFFGTTAWAQFRVRSEWWNPARGVKRESRMSEADRAAARDRLKAARAAMQSTAGA